MSIAIAILLAGLFGGLAAIGTGAAQAGVSKNVADKQIEANKEANDLSVAESEKAYQRSTPSNQIAEYVKAGLSETQAKALVAGTGAQATYTPAPVGSTMAGVDYSGLFGGIGNIGSGVGTMLDSVTNFYSGSSAASDGGVIGAALTEDIQSDLIKHFGDIPVPARSLSGFLQYAHSSDAPTWARSLVSSDKWNKAVSNVAGNKALRSFFDQSLNFATGDARLDGLVIQNQISRIQKDLTQVQLDEEQIQFARSSIEWAFDEPNMATFNQVRLEQAQKTLSTLTLDNQLLTDKEYRDKWIIKEMANLDQQALYATALRYIYEQKTDWLSDPHNAGLIGIYDAFKDAGITQTEAGVILASLEASDIPLTNAVKSLSEAIKGGLPSTEKLIEFRDRIYDGADRAITEASEAYQKMMDEYHQLEEASKDSKFGKFTRYLYEEHKKILTDDSLSPWQKFYLINKIRWY